MNKQLLNNTLIVYLKSFYTYNTKGGINKAIQLIMSDYKLKHNKNILMSKTTVLKTDFQILLDTIQ